MEVRANYIIVGICTIAVILCGLLFTMWISKSDRDVKMQKYDIYFKESVSGLSVNNDVLFTGIRVGSVSRITISKEEPGAVAVRISIDASVPVRMDSAANLEIRGVTGTSVVAISAGTAESPFLLPQNPEDVPIITARPSKLSAVMNEIPQTIKSANELLGRLNVIFGDENEKSFTAILASLAKISEHMAQRSEELDNIVKSMDSILQKVDRIAGTTQGIMENDVRATMSSIRDMTARIDDLTKKIEPGVRQFSQETLTEMRMFIAEARNFVRIMNRVGQKLESDPNRFFFGEQEKEFRPK